MLLEASGDSWPNTGIWSVVHAGRGVWVGGLVEDEELKRLEEKVDKK